MPRKPSTPAQVRKPRTAPAAAQIERVPPPPHRLAELIRGEVAVMRGALARAEALLELMK